MLNLAVAPPIRIANSLINEDSKYSSLWLNLQYLCNIPFQEGCLENRFRSLDGKIAVEKFDSSKTYLGVFYPYEYSDVIKNQSIRENLDELSKFSKSPIVVTKWDDDTSPTIPLADNILVFRTSAFDSQLRSHELVMPSWSDNKLRHLDHDARSLKASVHADLLRRPYRIGFCGNTLITTLDKTKIKIKRFFNYFKKPKPNSSSYNYFIGRYLRWKSIDKLRKTKDIELILHASPTFYAGVDLTKTIDLVAADLVFAANALSSDFSLVVRGAGNYSYRLFEVLEIGNIPIIVTSNMYLPLQQTIDWNSIAIFWDTTNNTNIVELINQWLADKESVNPNNFYKNYLEPASFLRLALKK